MLASPIPGNAGGDSVALRARNLLGFEVAVFDVSPDLRFGDADRCTELLDGVVCHDVNRFPTPPLFAGLSRFRSLSQCLRISARLGKVVTCSVAEAPA